MTKTFLRLPDVIKATGLGSSTIYEMIVGDHAENAKVEHPFPKPILLGKRATGWLADEILEWQNHKIAQRGCVSKTGARNERK